MENIKIRYELRMAYGEVEESNLRPLCTLDHSEELFVSSKP